MRVSWSGIKKFIKSGRKKKQTNQENILNDSCGFIVFGTWPAFFPSSQKKKKKVILYSYQSEIFLLSNESFIDQVCWSK